MSRRKHDLDPEDYIYCTSCGAELLDLVKDTPVGFNSKTGKKNTRRVWAKMCPELFKGWTGFLRKLSMTHEPHTQECIKEEYI